MDTIEAAPMSSLVELETVEEPWFASQRQDTVAGADAPGAADWTLLAHRAAEPNVFQSRAYLGALTRHVAGARTPRLIRIQDEDGTLTGQIPVISALKALFLPIPAAVALFPYMPLGTPLLAGDLVAAAGGLIDAAAASGLAMLALPMATLDGPVARAFDTALAVRGLEPVVRNAHERAALDARQDAEAYLRAGMGSKKLKELRRQRKRLEELGDVGWSLARTPQEIAVALERFLALEAKGWKGAAGSSLGQRSGDAAFIAEACAALAIEGAVEICELTLEGAPLASGIVFRAQGTAFFFKTAYDEDYARYSPGVQLTVALTRHFSEDPEVAFVDSTAAPGHPMIDHVWRERLAVGDLFIPTRRGLAPKLCIAAFDARAALRSGVKAAYSRFKGAQPRAVFKEDAQP
ncbi:GNAT family N-acetyltransferase [Pelagibacterium xiamenense]|uniref:GNAT family N-acetyltransferase n=1 Tax=Pelagibacterium xiamenense TaxID=2901140 RepID=UPI001E4EBC98|nr:GNAT family N-acetyltransferase [Pelagibacterium xiamenense]MCD7058383.1 GNAT family N-acetyltransferase [Pelagibacterium xiamenense]